MCKSLIVAGGLFHLAFAAFHLLFWRVFEWKEELRRLSSINRGVMQVLNLCLTFVFLAFAYLSLIHTRELLSTSMGHSLLSLIALFWLLRAGEQLLFFTLRHWSSWLFFALFLVGALLYGAPVFLFPISPLPV